MFSRDFYLHLCLPRRKCVITLSSVRHLFSVSLLFCVNVNLPCQLKDSNKSPQAQSYTHDGGSHVWGYLKQTISKSETNEKTTRKVCFSLLKLCITLFTVKRMKTLNFYFYFTFYSVYNNFRNSRDSIF